jgi:hypothetical protein
MFITADIISLILQAVGGGWAASVNPTPDAASNLMLAGIAFQLVVMILFLGLGIDFCLRAMRGKSYAYKLRKEERDLSLGERGDSNTALALRPTDAGAGARAGAFEMGGVPAGSRGQDVLEKGQAQTGPANAYSSSRGAMDRGWWLVMLGMAISSVAIIVRGKSAIFACWSIDLAISISTCRYDLYTSLISGVYRTIELSQGWDGELIHQGKPRCYSSRATITRLPHTTSPSHPAGPPVSPKFLNSGFISPGHVIAIVRADLRNAPKYP